MWAQTLRPRCQLCHPIHFDNTIIGPNNTSHTNSISSTYSSSNIIYAIKCQQWLSALYTGQSGQFLYKRIHGYKSDLKKYTFQKLVREYFTLPRHEQGYRIFTSLQMPILCCKNFFPDVIKPITLHCIIPLHSEVPFLQCTFHILSGV